MINVIMCSLSMFIIFLGKIIKVIILSSSIFEDCSAKYISNKNFHFFTVRMVGQNESVRFSSEDSHELLTLTGRDHRFGIKEKSD